MLTSGKNIKTGSITQSQSHRKMELQDVLLAYITLLNLNFENRQRWQGMDVTWIAARLDLMQRFLIPSLKAQHDQDFVWLVLVHPDTPESVLKQIQIVPQCRILKTESDYADKILFSAQTVEYLYNNFDRKLLVTVRIDSDDGVNPKHGSILKNFATNQLINEDGIFTDFTDGCIFNMITGLGYLLWSSGRSCGLSKIETLNLNATTIYCCDHTQISRKKNYMPIRTNEPMWVATTHKFHINKLNKKMPKFRRQHGTYFETRKIMEIFPSIDIDID